MFFQRLQRTDLGSCEACAISIDRKSVPLSLREWVDFFPRRSRRIELTRGEIEVTKTRYTLRGVFRKRDHRNGSQLVAGDLDDVQDL